MTKRSSWILVLSVLLCISMLFVSCGSDATDTEATNTSDTSDTTKQPTGEPIPENEKIDYGAIFGKWNTYLGYQAPEEEEETGATKLYNYYKDSPVPTLEDAGMFYKVVFPHADVAGGTTTKIYNRETGAQIGDVYVQSQDMDRTYSFRFVGCVLEVQIRTKATVGTPSVVTYDYYHADGTRLNGPVVTAEERYEITETPLEGGYRFVTVEDTVYLLLGNELVHTFARGEERLLPPTNREYNDYRYYISEAKGDTLYVLDAKDRICAHYQLNAQYDSISVAILSNGNVMIEYERACLDEETVYTYEKNNGAKVLIKQEILDVITGEVTEVPTEFKIARILTPETIGDFRLALKGDYQYAEIYRISDGAISPNKEAVILDNSLKVTETLPKIVKNQSLLLGALDSESLLILGEAFSESDGYVAYRATSKGVELYIDEIAHNTYGEPMYRFVKNGFIYNGTLYNDRMEPLYELSATLQSKIIHGGDSILAEEETEDGEKQTKLLYIENGALQSVVLGDEDDTVTVLDEGVAGFMVTDVVQIEVPEGEEPIEPIVTKELYSNKGKLLLSEDTVTIVSYGDESCLVRCVSESYTSYYVVR